MSDTATVDPAAGAAPPQASGLDLVSGTGNSAAAPATDAPGAQPAETPPSQWNNDAKPFNSVFTFHRIKSPSTNADNPTPDGKGYDCGCRSLEDYDPTFLGETLSELLKTGVGAIPVVGQIILLLNQGGQVIFNEDLLKDFAQWVDTTVEGLLFARFLGSIPEWVPVNRKSKDFQEEDREVEGLLVRSFLADSDTPYFQWNRWYSWNFHVLPIPLYTNLRGPGNRLTKKEIEKFTDDPDRGGTTPPHNEWSIIDFTPGPDYPLNAVSCKMDMGAIFPSPASPAWGDSQTDDDNGDDIRLTHPPGIMFEKNWPFWPMTGDYFWASGRWVYDCAHRTDEDPKKGLMPTLFHPMKAFACSRREAVEFDSGEGHVPATRFLFFATKLGGYFDFASLKGKDYEFIVDLPKPPPFGVEWPIGTQPPFPFNTGVLPPRIRILVDKAPFGIADKPFKDDNSQIKYATIDPIIEAILPDDPQQPPLQVKVTIPMSQLDDGDEAYGVLISLGWEDRDGSQADKVKKVTITFDQLGPGSNSNRGHWRMQMGVNGRWRWWGHDALEANHAPYQLGQTGARQPVSVPKIELFVPDDSAIVTSVFGVKRRGIGAIFELPIDSSSDLTRIRTLKTGGLIPIALPPEVNTLQQAYAQLPDEVRKKIPLSQFLDNFKDAKLDGDIFGKPKAVTWKDDIDTKQGADAAKKARASAIAREMARAIFLHFDGSNDPMGIVEQHAAYFVGTHLRPRSYFPFDSAAPGADNPFANPFPMKTLISLTQQGQNPLSSHLNVFPAEHRADGHILYYQDLLGEPDQDKNRDYQLFLSIGVQDQPRPKPPQAASASSPAPADASSSDSASASTPDPASSSSSDPAAGSDTTASSGPASSQSGADPQPDAASSTDPPTSDPSAA